MPERQRAIALACLVEPGTPGIAELVAEHGAEEALARAADPAAGARVVGRLDPEDVPGDAGRDVPAWACGSCVPGEPEFPSQLLDLPEPPLALWIRGPLDLRAAALRSVAVVGARACTAYGERATAAVAGGLAEDGWAVVSGGAFGIDAAAHRAALAVGGPDGCRPRLRRRRRLPAGPRRPAVPDRRLGAGGLRAAAGQPAAQAPVPGPQPGDRGAEPGHGRGGGRPAQRCGVHRLPGARARPGGHGRARAGHVDGQLRDQPAAARAGRPGPSATARRSRRCCAGRGSTTARARRRGRSEGTRPGGGAAMRPARRGAAWSSRPCPAVGAAPSRPWPQRAGISPAACLAHLGLLEIVGLARRTGSGWRRCG